MRLRKRFDKVIISKAEYDRYKEQGYIVEEDIDKKANLMAGGRFEGWTYYKRKSLVNISFDIEQIDIKDIDIDDIFQK